MHDGGSLLSHLSYAAEEAESLSCVSGNLCDLLRLCVFFQGRRVYDLRIIPVSVPLVIHLSHREALWQVKTLNRE